MVDKEKVHIPIKSMSDWKKCLFPHNGEFVRQSEEPMAPTVIASKWAGLAIDSLAKPSDK